MTTHLKTMFFGAIAAILASGAAATAQSPHVMTTLNDAKWGPAPPMLPPGAQLAVLSGDPTKLGPFAVRLKFPANYAIPAHSHPGDENVTVISGELHVGMGSKLVRKAATALGPGSYALLPAGMNHFAFTRSETTIILFGIGPVGFKYVNPDEDPRRSN
jgi:quercetin dioxygenase-like cupin family protein